MTQNTLVMKFGASVETLDHFSRVATIVKARKVAFQTIIVVVSAMQGMTNQLISYAHAVNPTPPSREYDMLVTVGERISCSLLAMALAAQGVSASSYTGSQAGIITSDEHTDAQIIDIRPHRLHVPIQNQHVIVVAGFQGISKGGAISSLGRGGSDTSAVALAIALGAEQVEFYKDVAGLYENNPKKDPQAAHLPFLSYAEALQVIERTGKALHPRCIYLAERNRVPLHVLSFKDWNPTSCLRTIIGEKGERPALPLYEESLALC